VYRSAPGEAHVILLWHGMLGRIAAHDAFTVAVPAQSPLPSRQQREDPRAGDPRGAIMTGRLNTQRS